MKSGVRYHLPTTVRSSGVLCARGRISVCRLLDAALAGLVVPDIIWSQPNQATDPNGTQMSLFNETVHVLPRTTPKFSQLCDREARLNFHGHGLPTLGKFNFLGLLLPLPADRADAHPSNYSTQHR
jgi:hypothetical protein